MKKIVPTTEFKKERMAKIWFERMLILTGLTLVLALIFYSLIPVKISLIVVLSEIIFTTVLYFNEKPRLKKDTSFFDETFIRFSKFS
jgi:hypothetical protein